MAESGVRLMYVRTLMERHASTDARESQGLRSTAISRMDEIDMRRTMIRVVDVILASLLLIALESCQKKCIINPDCNDGIPCTLDICHGGICSNDPMFEGWACEDGACSGTCSAPTWDGQTETAGCCIGCECRSGQSAMTTQ